MRRLARCRFAALRFHRELRYREGSTIRRWLRRAETEGIPVFNLAHLHPRHVSLRAAIVRGGCEHLQRHGRVRR